MPPASSLTCSMATQDSRWIPNTAGNSMTTSWACERRIYQSDANEARLFLEGDLDETFHTLWFRSPRLGDRDQARHRPPRDGGGAAAPWRRRRPRSRGACCATARCATMAISTNSPCSFTPSAANSPTAPDIITPTIRFGFTQTTVAHNTLVVDRQNQLEKASGGGRLLSWLPGPLFSSVEVDDPGCYAAIGLGTYRRRVAAVDCDGASYWIDTFRVRGGKEYDYSFHALLNSRVSVDPSTAKTVRTDPGSVFSAACNYSEDLTPAGRLKSFPDKQFYWEAPGHGYGFLGHPQTLQPGPVVRLEWSATDQTGDRLTWYHLPPARAELILAHVQSPVADQFDYALSHVRAPRDETVRFQSVIPRAVRGVDGCLACAAPGLVSGPSDLDAGGIEITGARADGTSKFDQVYLSCASDREPAAFFRRNRDQRDGGISFPAERMGVPGNGARRRRIFCAQAAWNCGPVRPFSGCLGAGLERKSPAHPGGRRCGHSPGRRQRSPVRIPLLHQTSRLSVVAVEPAARANIGSRSMRTTPARAYLRCRRSETAEKSFRPSANFPVWSLSSISMIAKAASRRRPGG